MRKGTKGGGHLLFLPLPEMPMMPVPQEKGKESDIPRKVLRLDKLKGMEDKMVKALCIMKGRHLSQINLRDKADASDLYDKINTRQDDASADIFTWHRHEKKEC